MNLLALVESPDHVCCRYRIRAFAPALERAGCSVKYERLERGIMSRILQLRRGTRFDVVILQRKLLPDWQLRILRRAARRLVFDFDDAVLFRDSNDPRGPDDFRRRRRFAAVMQAADTVVAGNDFLADCALRAGASVEDVHVIPTCIDPPRYAIARHQRLDGPPELVWIGSSGTLRGLEQADGIWKAVAAALPDLRLRLICDKFPHDFPVPLVQVPWAEADEARQLAAGHIGVSWLPDDVWSRGKCGLKVLQYQAAGLPVVANPVGCQNEMIRPGVNGCLVSTPAEWVDALRRLADDHELRRRMGLAARRDVETDYSVLAWSEAFVDSITGRPRAGASAPAAVRKPERPEPSAGGRSIYEPHAARVRTFATLKLVGGPQ
jgi:glycosyltransferase involved in cell wall biosynthesis